MEELMTAIRNLVADEYGRACDKFGPTNNSDHESYGVIKEEIEEACEDFNNVHNNFNLFWDATKNNRSPKEKQEFLSAMEKSAMFAAAELIQVAAMAYKAKVTNSCLTGGKGDVSDVTNK